ncbi:MAG TPA: A24 family peptidase [Planctomycetaceae bacterium]
MSWLAGPPWLPAAFAFLIGTVLGRFLNRCVDRFPRHEYLADQLASVARASEAERSLRKARGFGHRLPVVGWLLPGNPLARPRRRENLRCAAVELGNGLLLAALLWAEFPNGFVPAPPDPFGAPGLEFLAPAHGSLALQLVRFALHVVLVQGLLVASVIDLERMIIPDASTVPAMLLAVLVGTAAGGVWLVPVWYEDAGLMALLDFGDAFGGGIEVPRVLTDHPHLHGFLVSFAGLVVGGGTVWAVRLIGHWALGREAMGFGDVILMAMMGSFLGWQPVLAVFFLAPLCALLFVAFSAVTGTAREFPYGPWLSLAAVLLLVGWDAIWPYAGRFFLMGRMIPFVALAVLILLAILLRAMRLVRGDERWYPTHGGEWTSADQLVYLSQENPEPTPASWRGRRDGDWPGLASGRGTLGERRWRSAPPAGRNWRA